ncbi:UNVERIFIED_CONTAM: hypothetical protein FKN15_028536 [Acipenser sinensis]
MATLTSQSPYSSSVMSQLVLQASTKLPPMALIRRFGGAIELQDTALLARLAPGDMIALEAKYHLKCLVKLCNRAADSTGADDSTGAFAELVAYMEDVHMEESVSPVFQLADLAHIDSTISVLERFVVLLYDRTSDTMKVIDARKQLFTQKSRSLENIPPTQAALKQHIKPGPNS